MIGGGSLLLTLLLAGEFGAASFAGCVFCLVVALITAWPAWLMGRADMAAMRMGAIEAEGKHRTQWGRRLGLVGLFVCVAPVAYMIYSIFESLSDQ